MNNIILVGFMGTGKSAAGKLLARRLRWSFLDLDRMIEEKAGRSVPEIFHRDGEAGFRKRERRAVKSLSRRRSTVIATGGGVMLDDENVRTLKKLGRVICLSARPEMVLQRTAASLASRPMLRGADPLARIEELLSLREPFYAKADATIDTSSRSIEEVVQEILAFLPDRCVDDSE